MPPTAPPPPDPTDPGTLRRGPDLSVGLASFGTPPASEPGATGSWRNLLAVAQGVEAAGIDRIVLPDHVVLGPNVADYPWGRFPTGPEADWPDPLTVIAAMAAATERVRFMTGILVAALRPPAVLAKVAATIDVVSEGRLDLGVGVGWQREEFDAVGLDFEQRGPLLERCMAACRTLWSGDSLPVTGVDGTASEVWCAPTPAQHRLPVWFSGTANARNVRRVATLGDGWIPIMGATVDDVARGTQAMRSALAEAGRDPASLVVRASPVLVRADDATVDLDATLAQVPDLVAAGATDIHVPLRAFASDGTVPALVHAAHRLAGAFAVRADRG
jgi:probable F420-dependent oxidoreductase